MIAVQERIVHVIPLLMVQVCETRQYWARGPRHLVFWQIPVTEPLRFSKLVCSIFFCLTTDWSTYHITSIEAMHHFHYVSLYKLHFTFFMLSALNLGFFD